MKQIKYENNIIKYPSTFSDISFKKYLEITRYISENNSTNLKMVIFDLLNNLVEVEGDISVDDLPVSVGKDIVSDITKVVNELSNYQINITPEKNKQVTTTNSKILKVDDKNFLFEVDLSKMKMSKYIELELLLGDTSKNIYDILTGLLGKLFREVVKENEEIIYLDTDEETIIRYLMEAKAVELIKYINFFLSIGAGSKTDLKKPSKRIRSTKQK